MGRHTKYQDDFCDLAEQYASKGLNDKQIAKMLGVSQHTLIEYQKKYPSFVQSLKKGREISDELVVNALFQRACGYSHPDTHISNYQGTVNITPIIKHYPPDTTAAIFWLCNRCPDKWKSLTKADESREKDVNLKDIAEALRNNYGAE